MALFRNKMNSMIFHGFTTIVQLALKYSYRCHLQFSSPWIIEDLLRQNTLRNYYQIVSVSIFFFLVCMLGDTKHFNFPQ